MRKLLASALVALAFLGCYADARAPSNRTAVYTPRSFALLLDFARDRYFHNGAAIGPLTAFTTSTRSGVANMDNAAGVWTSFPANTARRSDKGLRVETSRTNRCLWNRDLTNAVWVKVNATAALDQTGIDGGANSASSLTATAGNATALQSITNASAARVQSAFVRRLSGSGTINMTMDGGLTWTPIAVTSAWQQLKIPTQTLANPVVGFQIVTSGDSIAVDAVQTENNNTGDFATAPIFTTTANVSRNLDQLTITTIANFADIFQKPRLTIILRYTVFTVIPGGNVLNISDGTDNNRYTLNFASFTASTGLSGATVVGAGVTVGYDPMLNLVDTVGRRYCFVAALDQIANKVGVTLNGDSKEYANSTWPSPAALTTVEFGEKLAGGPFYGYLQIVAATPDYLSAGQRRAACASLPN